MNRKRIKLLLALAALFTAPVMAAHEAGSIEPGWYIYPHGTLFFFLSGTKSGGQCSIPERWAIDLNTNLGKMHYAAFLMAYSSGKQIQA